MTQILNTKTVFLIFTSLLLSSCATLTAQDCEQMDWRERGLKDGRAGEEASQLARYKKQCGEFNLSVDAKLYKAGYQAGLKDFCTYENGVEQGESGEKNQNVCPSDLAPEFNKGHVAGYKVYKLKEELEEQREKQEDELKKQREQAEDDQKDADEAALKRMNECTFDSDCESRKCVSMHESVGSASGHVKKCR